MKIRRYLVCSRTGVPARRLDGLREFGNVVFEFSHFFVELREDAGDLWPVKSDGSSLATQLRRLNKRGHGARYPAEDRFPAGLCRRMNFFGSFSLFESFPVADDLLGAIGFRIAKHVRMALHQLVRESVDNVINREIPGFFRHLCVEEDLKEQ